jgi:hypothetical protein
MVRVIACVAIMIVLASEMIVSRSGLRLFTVVDSLILKVVLV